MTVGSYTLHADILAITQQFTSEVTAVSNRVSHIGNKMGESANTFNDMVDAYYDRNDAILNIKTKLADLENRSSRNNVKIRGIPESVKTSESKGYFVNLMKATLPEVPLEELVVDRIHRLPRPKNIPNHLPRDTIVRVHFYHIKDTRRRDELPHDMQELSFLLISMLLQCSNAGNWLQLLNH